MSAKDAHLYGVPRPSKRPTTTTVPNPTTTAFSSALSSLITSKSPPVTDLSSRPVPKPKKTNPTDRNSIFTTHNRLTKKRAAADVDDLLAPSSALAHEQKHTTSSTTLDDSSWRRTKRKLDEKARLYAALKRGDVEDKSEKYGVDFDRKWAEREEAARLNGDQGEESEQSDGSDDDGDDDMKEKIEWVDEFGRTRETTRAEMIREQRSALRQSRAQVDLVEEQARPAMPSNVIYGDTIQTAAFAPEEDIAAKMARIAAERDREPTPPKDVHYDARSEVRTKGTGFYQFSGEKEERRAQMKGLDKLRQETEESRGRKEDEKEAARARRAREVEERRKVIREKKEKMMANRFLDDMGREYASREKGGDEETK